MVQGIQSANTNVQESNFSAKNLLNSAKDKVLQLKTDYDKFDSSKKTKVSYGLAASSVFGSLLTLAATTGGKKITQTMENGAKTTFKKQNSLLKWVGLAISVVSAAAVFLLGPSTKVTKAESNEQTPNNNAEANVPPFAYESDKSHPTDKNILM